MAKRETWNCLPLWKRVNTNPPFGKGGRGGILGIMLSYDKQLKALSQYLRKNMTDAEKMLWVRLRRKQLKGYPFYRQKIIGKYIVDFYCPKANLPRPSLLKRGSDKEEIPHSSPLTLPSPPPRRGRGKFQISLDRIQ